MFQMKIKQDYMDVHVFYHAMQYTVIIWIKFNVAYTLKY